MLVMMLFVNSVVMLCLMVGCIIVGLFVGWIGVKCVFGIGGFGLVVCYYLLFV